MMSINIEVILRLIKRIMVAIPLGIVISIIALIVPLKETQIRRIKDASEAISGADPGNSNQNWSTVREAMEYLNWEFPGMVCGGLVRWASGSLGGSRECLIPRKSRTHFEKYNLTRYELARVALPEALLSGAMLVGADLSGAKLHGAELHSAILRGAILRDAELIEADLAHAVLVGADLSDADLRGVRNLKQGQLDEACANSDHSPKNIPTDLEWNESACDGS